LIFRAGKFSRGDYHRGAALPSIVDMAGYRWPAALPEPKVNLGPDLRRGSHLMLEADPTRPHPADRGDGGPVRKLHAMAQPVRISDISNNNGSLSFDRRRDQG
jgi:preprotein translocase subunit SecD